MRLLFTMFFLFLFLAGCNNCPPNVYLGRVDLTSETKSRIVYTDAKLAIFRNEQGDLLPMEISNFNRIQLSEGLIIGQTCNSARDDSRITGDFEYVSGELSWPDSAFNFGRALDIGILYGFQVLEYSPDTVLVDVANVYSILRNQNAPGPEPRYGYLIQLISDRGHEGNRIDQVNEYTYLPDTTMLGRTFEEVYRPVNNGLIYYSPGEGVIAFRDGEGELWVLERVE